MGGKAKVPVIIMVLILGIMETRAIARREMDEKHEKDDDPELTVEEVCSKASNTSTCIKNFGPLAKNNGKARLTYYLDEGAKMARDELTKAYKVVDTLKPKAQKSPNAQYIVSCLEGCKHNIDQALDRLGGGEANESSSGDGNADSETNLFFTDALTDTTTCLDELEMGEDPEVFKAADDALGRAREIIRNLLGISHIFIVRAKMGTTMMVSVTLMILILGIVETGVMATREIGDNHEKEVDPELTVEEVCARASNTSTCIKNFEPLANNNNGKARLSYYLDEGAKMARAELTKAYKFTDNLTPKAEQSANSKYVISCLEGCKHYIDLAMDRLGGHSIGEGEGEAPAAAPGPSSGSSLDDSDTNLFFTDALTFTTTCLDELEIGETPEVFDAMDDALSQAREVIRNLLGISHVFSEPMFPIS
ncbi:hypothetical protein Cgig2_031163 [Carnegiea gigantea]|uniref:Pectinesterase inhibitor domain-containing protein n=1 Tax=Carnegiea gigantea TaxID=171969 RepID=A0A9Q1KR31_9CARY|nr:hypothetical protein Cgig2_031163 [Carnegiea gigantea]